MRLTALLILLAALPVAACSQNTVPPGDPGV